MYCFASHLKNLIKKKNEKCRVWQNCEVINKCMRLEVERNFYFKKTLKIYCYYNKGDVKCMLRCFFFNLPKQTKVKFRSLITIILVCVKCKHKKQNEL